MTSPRVPDGSLPRLTCSCDQTTRGMPKLFPAASHWSRSAAGTRQAVGCPQLSAAATASATYVLPLPTGSARIAPRYRLSAASARRKLGCCLGNNQLGGTAGSSVGARLPASEATTARPHEFRPGHTAVDNGSGTATRDSATIAGAVAHHGKEDVLGVTR